MNQHKGNWSKSKTEPRTWNRENVHEYNKGKPCNGETVKSFAHGGTQCLGGNLYRTVNNLDLVKLLNFKTEDIILQASRWINKSFIREEVSSIHDQ